MILGAVDIQRIKSIEPPILIRLKPDTDPGLEAEFTTLGRFFFTGKSTFLC